MTAGSREEFREIVRQTRQLVKSLPAFGITELPMNPKTSEGEPPMKSSSPKKTLSLADKEKQLAPVREKALACRACVLCETRNKVVFGEGSLDADLVFVGEGPGRDEDAQGRPFVGAAGNLLTRMIEAMKMTREEVYICNVVKCRPPQNRPPEPDEIAACAGYLESQLLTLRPKIICALGKTAASALLKTESPMGELRGQTFEWQGIPLVVTYHPAYLLRNPAAKKEVWEDMKRVLEMLGRTIPSA